MAGYKSDLMLLPDQGIGAVLLTNSDNGGMLLRPFMRRLLEVTFDGKPEAVGDVARAAGGIVFDFGEWKSAVASRKNDDGTISFITVDPTIEGFEFVAGTREGKRVLVVRDGQHEYVFTEGS